MADIIPLHNSKTIRSVEKVLNHPARMRYDFKVKQEHDAIRLRLTIAIIEDILRH